MPLLPCPFHAMTGLYCPLCGGQRLVLALAHGDLAGAWAQNPLLLLGLGLGAGLLAFRWISPLGITVRMPRAPAARHTLSWVAVAVVVAFTVLRNIPGITGLGPV